MRLDMEYNFKKIIIITGYYGCGKTNLAANIALRLKSEYPQKRITIADADTVNYYFRSADFTDVFSEKGIDVVSPAYANSNLDIPVLDYDMERLIAESDHLIADVGGDDAGAFALGRYAPVFAKHSEDIEVFYVYNALRGISAAETAENVKAVETASRLKCTALINNTNLGAETSEALIRSSEAYASEMEELTGLKHAFVCVPEEYNYNNEKGIFPVKRLVKLPWEE